MPNEHVFQSSADPATFAHHCYDVLVVGAGPAGSSAAYHLARQGADVLLVDRFAFPRDKRCGDGIVTAALEELALMGIANEVQARYSVSSHVALWLYGMKNITDCDASEHFTVGFVAPRKSFDALLCEHALRAGASWLDHVTVHEVAVGAGVDVMQGRGTCVRPLPDVAIVRGVYKGSQLRIQAHIVIAADGSGSRLARQLRKSLLEKGVTDPITGPEVPMTRFTAMRGYYRNIERLKEAEDAMEFYMQTEPGTYYYWIFPMDDGLANVGVIAHIDQLREHHPNLAQAVRNFLQSTAVNGRATSATLQGQLGAAPISSGMRGTALYGDHLLCVGDAAALVYPVTAEGISGALTSGRLAAETALKALEQGNYSRQALSPYGEAIRARYEMLYDTLLQNEMNLE
jgi:geranylgeranyl reductase family protein